jgi:hypothetical protein
LHTSSQLNYEIKGTEYPHNLLRNTAVKFCKTKYVLVIDIDMLPNEHLRRDFREFVVHYNLLVFGTSNRLRNKKVGCSLISIAEAVSVCPLVFQYNFCPQTQMKGQQKQKICIDANLSEQRIL